jgi:KaiC/GvpD/RAD55 family RecA-like ATPase
MDIEKQKLLLSFLISNQELYITVSPILKATYFDPRVKPVVKFIQSYFDEYKSPPTPELIKAETSQSIELKTSVSKQEVAYASKELETFCKHRAMEEAVYGAPALINAGQQDEVIRLMREAVTISLQRNIGLNYFQDPEARLTLMSLNSPMTPTGFHKLDENLGGGINRQEMIIFCAPSGVGKSISMANVAKNLLKQGLNGVYITFELSESVTAKRFDSMFTGIAQTEIFKDITKVSIEVMKQAEGHGKLFITRMPESTTNANHIRAYLKEFEIVNGFLPDWLVIDYLDLMASTQPVSAENVFIKDKFVSEELRGIAHEYNLIMITASQLNRSAQNIESIDDLNQSHIAGGISKIMTADNVVAIMQDKQMKARGEMFFVLLKTRSSGGVGNNFMMYFNPVTLILENIETGDGGKGSGKNLSSYIKSKKTTPTPAPSGKMNVHNIPFQV